MKKRSLVPPVVAVLIAASTLAACVSTTIRGRQVIVTSNEADVAGCRLVGHVTSVILEQRKEDANKLGADVLFASGFKGGDAYDCGGRYLPTVRTVPAATPAPTPNP